MFTALAVGTVCGLVNGVLIASLYAPNGNPQPGPKFDYKLAWLDALYEHAQSLIDCKAPAILIGDYNVIPTDLDVYKPENWKDDALMQPESRAAFRRILHAGWTDAIRARHPDGAQSSFRYQESPR